MSTGNYAQQFAERNQGTKGNKRETLRMNNSNRSNSQNKGQFQRERKKKPAEPDMHTKFICSLIESGEAVWVSHVGDSDEGTEVTILDQDRYFIRVKLMHKVAREKEALLPKGGLCIYQSPEDAASDE